MVDELDVVDEVDVAEEVDVVAPPRFRDRLGKARAALAGTLASVRARGGIDDDTWDDLEEALIRADVGVGRTTELLDDLRDQVKTEGITTPDEAARRAQGRAEGTRLGGCDRSLVLDPRPGRARTCGCSSA